MSPPKIISLVSIRKADNLEKSLELKLFYDFPLNIRAQMQLQSPNPTLNYKFLPELETISHCLNESRC